MQLILLRHGQTPGNLARRYIGRTDEALSEAGLAQARELSCPDTPLLVFSSPLKRAVQTAGAIWPQARIRLVPDLRELDFGDFEGLSADEMADNPAYRQWVEGNCQGPCPGGEDPVFFRQRVLQAFAGLVEEAIRLELDRLAVVAHGGSIMTIMAEHARPGKSYFDWHVPNLSGYRITIDPATWAKEQIFIHFYLF